MRRNVGPDKRVVAPTNECLLLHSIHITKQRLSQWPPDDFLTPAGIEFAQFANHDRPVPEVVVSAFAPTPGCATFSGPSEKLGEVAKEDSPLRKQALTSATTE